MTEQWTCPQCQQTNDNEMRFCPHCGAANPALPVPATVPGSNWPTSAPGSRRSWWIAALALWLLGCAVLAVGGGFWWSRQSSAPPATLVVVVEVSPSPTLLPPTPTFTPLPSPTATLTPPPPPEPIETVTVTPGATEPADIAAGDSLAADHLDDSAAPVGDTLALPTRPPEGVILFLSSRDHDPQTEDERKRLAQHRDLELYAMRPDGSEAIRLSDGQQAWSSDIAWLTLYAQPNQVVINNEHLFDLSNGQVAAGLAVEFALPDAATPLRANYPVWSLNGDMLFFGIKGQSGNRIYYLEKGQTRPRQLTDPPDGVWGDGWSSLSPDGTWIAFERFWEDPAKNGLWLIKTDGSEAHRIVEGETRRAFWSPDGRQLAFEGPKTNGATSTFSFDIWVTEMDGSNPRSLTALPENVNAWEPKWSPDGQRLVFEIERSFSDRQLYVIDVDGGEPELITDSGEHNIAPLWLPLSFEELRQWVAAYPTPTPPPTPKPVVTAPKPVSNCPPGAQITSPAPGDRFTQRYNYILGIANIPQFHHWRMEYSTSPGGGWNYLLERDYPVDNDKLIMLDARTVPRGPYGLRLTVVDVTGNYPEPCEVWFVNAY